MLLRLFSAFAIFGFFISNSLAEEPLFIYEDYKIEPYTISSDIERIDYDNGTSVLLSTCDVYRVFTAYAIPNKVHKYFQEIRLPSGEQKTIALEYGAADFLGTKLSGDYIEVNNDNKGQVPYSFFFDLSQEDPLADSYKDDEIEFAYVLTDDNDNLFYEIKYNDKVVGIKYFCSNNNAEYIRYFAPKS